MAGKYIGIDLGGTAIKFGEVTEDGKIVAQWQVDTSKDVIGTMAEEIKSHYDLADINGIGMTVPGPISNKGFLPVCANVPEIKNTYPAKDLSAKLGAEGSHIKCAAGNDGKLAALGEYAFGAAKKYNSLIMATIGTAIGGGIILDGGNMIYGAHDVAAELSHIHVKDGEEVQCGCGGHGCLEQYASGTGLVREAKRALDRSDEPSALRVIDRDKMQAVDVVNAAKHGDALADGVVRYCFGYLGQEFANLSVIIDPEVYIIGGGVSKAGQYLIDVIREKYESSIHLFKEPADIVLAELGNDAGILGAAKLVM
ncbi:MAG: ROK family protein [Lachnospiraceae bacterium]|nr:ROK family protein [Candidatus Darwinimomas equi]